MKALGALVFALLAAITGQAQTTKPVVSDSIVAAIDSMYRALEADTATLKSGVEPLISDSALAPLAADAKKRAKKAARDWSSWRPNPQRALWLALVFPGGGQIYNRKYWKLPLVYGGFVGCIYALTWNNMMYRDYAQAYLDLMDDDPNTCSYNSFMHLGKQIDKSNEERYKQLFKKRKDRYRRWRDMSFFVMVGIYALSVIDAYVDAELSEFDISKDLSLRLSPTVIGSQEVGAKWGNASVGVNCSLNF